MQTVDWDDNVLKTFEPKDWEEQIKKAREEMEKPEVKEVRLSKWPYVAEDAAETYRKFIEKK